MKLEISDQLLIIIIVFLSILVIGMLIIIIYYRLERRIKNKVRRELEDARKVKNVPEKTAQRLEKAGIREKTVIKNYTAFRKDSRYSAPHKNLSIEIDKEGIGISMPNAGGLFVTTTSRLRINNQTEQEEGFHPAPRTERLELNMDESRTESRRTDTDCNHTPRGGEHLNNTLEKIRNYKIETNHNQSVDIENLEKTHLKAPKDAFEGMVSIQYKGEGTSPNTGRQGLNSKQGQPSQKITKRIDQETERNDKNEAPTKEVATSSRNQR